MIQDERTAHAKAALADRRDQGSETTKSIKNVRLLNRNKLAAVGVFIVALAIGVSTASAAKKGGPPEAPKEVGKTVGKEPDMSKPVQVFVLLGQSNIVGLGRIGGGDGGFDGVSPK